MVNQAEEPLKRVTLNLFESDYEWFVNRYEHYQDAIRRAVRLYKLHILSEEDDARICWEEDQ